MKREAENQTSCVAERSSSRVPDTTTEVALWDERRLSDPHGQSDKAARVRKMFDSIAPTYERVNRIASVGRDAFWRGETVRLADVRPADCVLDIACGTGSLANEFARAGLRRIVGLDVASEMLRRFSSRSDGGAVCCQADALRLPFGNSQFDVVSCAFGVRNFQDLHTGLCEVYRVLRPNGRAVILEFAWPKNPVVRWLYHAYAFGVLPQLARWISRDRTGAYRYLSHSILTYTTPEQIGEQLSEVGFSSVRIRRLTGGIVFVLRADKGNITPIPLPLSPLGERVG